jgi:DNA-binding transcriptional ArsR family regulator
VSDAVGLSQSQDDHQSVSSVPTDDDSGPEGPSTTDSDVGGDDTTEGEEETPEPELPLDQVFEILKNSRRRETLHYLEDNGGEASLSDLAEHIAALENDTTVAAISSSQRKRVYVGLYQCHLPKMDDMDIIDFNQNRGTIVRAANADQLVPYLEDSTQPPWHRMYGSITAAGGGLFLLSVFGNAPLGLTPTVVLAALVAAMALCSIAHARHAATEE